MTDTNEMVERLLTELKEINGVKACAAVTRNGLLICSNMHELFTESMAAMSATMLGAAETASSHVKLGRPSRIIVESDDGKMIIEGAGPKAFLVILAHKDSPLNLMLMELDKSANKLNEILI